MHWIEGGGRCRRTLLASVRVARKMTYNSTFLFSVHKRTMLEKEEKSHAEEVFGGNTGGGKKLRKQKISIQHQERQKEREREREREKERERWGEKRENGRN
jgi:5'-3' exonuclease